MATPNSNEKNIQISAKLTVAGKEMNFVELSVIQAYGEHHQFSIKLDYVLLQQTFMDNPLEQIELNGQPVTIQFMHGDGGGTTYPFKGIITDVRKTGERGQNGYFILSGYSPTILLDRGKRYDIYSDMSLKKVFEEAAYGIDDNLLEIVNSPIHKGKVDFLMQYNETDWEFLKRTAYLYTENIFYSGSQLLIGEYEEFSTINLTYDKEITSFQSCTKYLPNMFLNYEYMADRDDTLTRDTPKNVENSDVYIDKMHAKNASLNSELVPNMPIEVNAGDVGSLLEFVKRKQVRNAAKSVYIYGEANTYKPTIGRIIQITLPKNMSNGRELGTYRVIKSKHIIDQNHRYTNEFEAVPAKLKVMPVDTPPVIPTAHSVRATVTSNQDPQAIGRVQVDFPFADKHYSKAWLRVMTPNAGMSEDVSKNRGFVFIPEKGDQVMIGFEFGNPNFPFVMGSMFHGKNGMGGQAENHIKSMITRSGHTLEFDDAEESLSITLKDKKGNFLHIDSKGNNIEITALETMTLTAKNIIIQADENISAEAGKNMDIQVGENQTNMVGGDIKTRSANHSQDVSEASNVTIGTKLDITSGETKFVAESGDFTVQSAGVALIQGAEDARISKA
ncbi:type VI secretion system Vgr family protein [Dysgonomonas sp. ZJ709]|uniref:type VI secretion system Vgr family protein n=1 Tax=Dysgonomonas sp. ZJ709 TaxID=2709797 RepID=UPI0013ED0EDB|nr:phage baseplate assembly protein V [Dysgonomonas sp. ZJ709]